MRQKPTVLTDREIETINKGLLWRSDQLGRALNCVGKAIFESDGFDEEFIKVWKEANEERADLVGYINQVTRYLEYKSNLTQYEAKEQLSLIQWRGNL